MARPRRTIDDLIGQTLYINERRFLSPMQRAKRAFMRHIVVRIVRVTTHPDGRIASLYVVKAKCFRPKPGKKSDWYRKHWRLPTEAFVKPIRRYRWYDQEKFRWKVAYGERGNRSEPECARLRTRGSAGWSHGRGPTVGWWLNNPDLIEQVVLSRWDERKHGADGPCPRMRGGIHHPPPASQDPDFS